MGSVPTKDGLEGVTARPLATLDAAREYYFRQTMPFGLTQGDAVKLLTKAPSQLAYPQWCPAFR